MSSDIFRSVIRFLTNVVAYVAASVSGMPASVRNLVHVGSSFSRSAILKCGVGDVGGKEDTEMR